MAELQGLARCTEGADKSPPGKNALSVVQFEKIGDRWLAEGFASQILEVCPLTLTGSEKVTLSLNLNK